MRRARGSVVRGALLGVLLTFAVFGVSPAAATTIAAAYPSWSPTTATIAAGESVTFESNESLAHGVGWQAATPSCTGVPGPAQPGPWSGSCTFTVTGSYPFVCTLHGSMTGTITVTGPEKPTVITGNATGVNDTEATLNGSVDPNEQATTYFFKWGTSTTYTETTSSVSAGSGSSAVPVSAGPLAGLQPKTTYHYRLFANNASGTSEGLDKTFTTSGSPTATTTGTTGLGDTKATLQGTVNPFGHATTYFFKWGLTEAYGSTTSTVSAGSGFNAVSATAGLTGLTPETEYHFRLVAENGLSQKSEGVDKTFMTTATPPPPPPPPDPLPTPITPVITLPPPVTPPDTRITLKPAARTKDRTPTFKFKSTVAGATFKCTLDAKALKRCRSPLTTKKLSFGRHTLKVTAVVGGKSDPTPAAFTFKVLKPR